MDKEKAINFIENSFLSPLLASSDITDISYNGEDIYYLSNTKGRKKSDIVILKNNARDFVRQIANFCEKQFSFSDPNLDVSIGKYRINATHQSIARKNEEEVTTFSIRIASENIRIKEDSDFLTPEINSLLKVLVDSRVSLVIGGLTSSGKTEFQKYLLTLFKENERVIVIDNVNELDRLKNNNIDLTCWLVDENNKNASNKVLIRNALRNNPDWLILAEARGKEMVDILHSATTGIPLITTIHSIDAYSLPFRMGRMMMQSEEHIVYQEALIDIYYHFHFYFYLKKEIVKGVVKRYISQINYIDNEGKVFEIYKKKSKSHKYEKLPDSALSIIETIDADNLFKTTFLGGKKYE